jgi:dolichol kinase
MVDDGSVAFFALLWRTPRLLLLTLGILVGYVFAVAFPPALERVVSLPGLDAMVVPVGAVMFFYSN